MGAIITVPLLLAAVPGALLATAPAIVSAINDNSQFFNTPARLAYFLGQASHESQSFQLSVEIWGPTAAQRGYEGRADLGNTQKGDGYRFRGRGYFQLTGRNNYKRFGDLLSLDLVNNPELAAEPRNAMRIAIAYWAGYRRVRTSRSWPFAESITGPQLADRGDTQGATRFINGGTNGYDDRVRRTNIALAAIRKALPPRGEGKHQVDFNGLNATGIDRICTIQPEYVGYVLQINDTLAGKTFVKLGKQAN